MPDVIIVGAGLAGLSCARRLQDSGISSLILESADAVGGRMRTDRVDGFRLDRGFQVFLSSYPEAQSLLDYSTLQLKPFWSGALIRFHGKFHELADPWRRPMAGLRSAFAPIGTLKDKFLIARFRSQTLRGSLDDCFRVPEIPAITALRQNGFSESMIDRFFRPFLGGVFLDPQLQTSSRMLQFVFRMFSQGQACLPAQGMEAIPRQLAAALPAQSIRLNTRVAQVQQGQVTLDSGEQLPAKAVVLAVEEPAVARLLGEGESTPAGQGTTCIYFAAKHPPVDKPLLVLNGEGRGPINSLCVPTLVAPEYGPEDESLVSVSVLGTPAEPAHLMSSVQKQLGEWFGDEVQNWKHLRTYSIPYALPNQAAPALAEPQRSIQCGPGIFVCGDHRDNASIQGALVSGRRAAEAITWESS